MAEYRDIISFRPREGGKPFAQKLGSARVNDDGTIDMYFDALPVPSQNKKGDMQVHARISPRQEKAGGYGGGGKPVGRPAPRRDEMDDEVPF